MSGGEGACPTWLLTTMTRSQGLMPGRSRTNSCRLADKGDSCTDSRLSLPPQPRIASLSRSAAGIQEPISTSEDSAPGPTTFRVTKRLAVKSSLRRAISATMISEQRRVTICDRIRRAFATEVWLEQLQRGGSFYFVLVNHAVAYAWAVRVGPPQCVCGRRHRQPPAGHSA